MAQFSEVLASLDELTLQEQEVLLDILRRRIVEQNRELLVSEVEEARREYAEGRCRTTDVDDLMDEILS